MFWVQNLYAGSGRAAIGVGLHPCGGNGRCCFGYRSGGSAADESFAGVCGSRAALLPVLRPLHLQNAHALLRVGAPALLRIVPVITRGFYSWVFYIDKNNNHRCRLLCYCRCDGCCACLVYDRCKNTRKKETGQKSGRILAVGIDAAFYEK